MTTPDMTVVDGTEALAYVIIKPGRNDRRIVVDAAANGISKADAAYVLRQVADQWDPPIGATVAGQRGPREAK